MAFAQGGQSLSGLVMDDAGGVIPGASVAVRNNATGESFEAVTNEAGAFSVPAIAVGTYSVTITLQGFKTAVVNDVRVVTATPASLRATLEVGSLAETVEVRAGSELIQTQSTTVTSTIGVEQISELPVPSRNALSIAAMLPGVETTAGPRGSTFSGLPNNTINVTIDGVTTGNQLQSTDGFFSMVTPRPRCGRGSDSDGGDAWRGQRARRGADRVHHALGHQRVQQQHLSLLQAPEPELQLLLQQHQRVGEERGHRSSIRRTLGQTIVIPGLFNGRNRAFYFFNFEHLHQPSEATRTRSILNPDAERGLFTYLTASGTTSVDLLREWPRPTVRPPPWIRRLRRFSRTTRMRPARPDR